MNTPIISQLQLPDEPVEVVERKGLGHPDTICDALAETLSRTLCREYRSRYGTILHHNVDKALLCAGRATAAFGGGRVLDPMHIYLGGRAITELTRLRRWMVRFQPPCGNEFRKSSPIGCIMCPALSTISRPARSTSFEPVRRQRRM